MLLSLCALSVLSATAQAAPDLEVTLSLAASVVDTEETHTVRVKNKGPHQANSVTLTLQLPETNTSPSVYVLGTLGSHDSRCIASGTTLQCALGRIKSGKSVTLAFDMALPWSDDLLAFEATAASSSTDANPADNIDVEVASVSYLDLVVSGPQDITNRHCTGTNLTAFYECTLFPSSLSSHQATLEADGSISFPSDYPSGYGGSWGQDSDDHLWMVYTEDSVVIGEFEGNGVSGSCFEGLTLFPGSSYVSPYEVCLD